MSGCFSSFTRVTGSLSVVEEYLGLEGGPPMFRPGFTSPDLLEASLATSLQDYHLLRSDFHRLFTMQSSLSAFARRYLRSRGCFPFLRLLRCFSSPGSPPHPMHSDADDPYGPGCPIRKSQDQSSVTSSSGLIAGSNVLHRLSTPRHPPCALSSLTVPTSTRSPRGRIGAGIP